MCKLLRITEVKEVEVEKSWAEMDGKKVISASQTRLLNKHQHGSHIQTIVEVIKTAVPTPKGECHLNSAPDQPLYTIVLIGGKRKVYFFQSPILQLPPDGRQAWLNKSAKFRQLMDRIVKGRKIRKSKISYTETVTERALR